MSFDLKNFKKWSEWGETSNLDVDPWTWTKQYFQSIFGNNNHTTLSKCNQNKINIVLINLPKQQHVTTEISMKKK